MEEFEIIMEVFTDGKYSTLKFQVEVFYNTAQVQRFRLTGGKKIMELEKRLLVKKQPWKVIKTNFTMKEVNDETVLDLDRVCDRVNEHMTGKSRHKLQTLQDKVSYKYSN